MLLVLLLMSCGANITRRLPHTCTLAKDPQEVSSVYFHSDLFVHVPHHLGVGSSDSSLSMIVLISSDNQSSLDHCLCETHHLLGQNLVVGQHCK